MFIRWLNPGVPVTDRTPVRSGRSLLALLLAIASLAPGRPLADAQEKKEPTLEQTYAWLTEKLRQSGGFPVRIEGGHRTLSYDVVRTQGSTMVLHVRWVEHYTDSEQEKNYADTSDFTYTIDLTRLKSAESRKAKAGIWSGAHGEPIYTVIFTATAPEAIKMQLDIHYVRDDKVSHGEEHADGACSIWLLDKDLAERMAKAFEVNP